MFWVLSGILLLVPAQVSPQVLGDVLGAGTGLGSCRAYPYRAREVQWEVCPAGAACCSEFGYCRPQVHGK